MSPGPPRYELMREVFLRGLGIVYAIAFASLAVQIVGLVGENGILPAGDHLERARESLGARAYYELPTLGWLSVGDGFLVALAWGGFAVSLVLAAGIAPLPCLLVLWLLYLSLSVVCQAFLYYQWDTLLLETGLLAALFAPASRPAPRASDIVRWLLWGLLFKLMFLSGITKVVSGDPTWAGGTALAYHYETQPLPSWTSWYAHQLPEPIQLFSLGFMWLAELVAPFAILAPRRCRWIRWGGCGAMVGFQLAIAATGNYGFFNALTIVLCLTLLDDDCWRHVLPPRWRDAGPSAPSPRWAGAIRAAAAVVLIPLSLLAFVREIAFTAPSGPGLVEGRPLAWSDPLVAWARPFRSSNGYGLFRVMTTERREIAIEARTQGGGWQELPFRWKPGALDEAPRFTGPHMPRLDWQMWFAGLDPQRHQHWLAPLMKRLLEGSPEVWALLGERPPDAALPDELRLVAHRYHFARPGQASQPAHWWRRERLGELSSPISLRTFEPRR